jgi:hypothetical protein
MSPDQKRSVYIAHINQHSPHQSACRHSTYDSAAGVQKKGSSAESVGEFREGLLRDGRPMSQGDQREPGESWREPNVVGPFSAHQAIMLANETNRIFWYKFIGTRKKPRFGPRQQVTCDDFLDSTMERDRSAALADDPKTPRC